MRIEDIGDALGVPREDTTPYYQYVTDVGTAYAAEPHGAAFLCDTYSTLAGTLAKALTELGNLNLGTMNENRELKRKLEESNHGPVVDVKKIDHMRVMYERYQEKPGELRAVDLAETVAEYLGIE